LSRFTTREKNSMLTDRRRNERITLVRPAKMLNCRSRKYVPAETCNLSQTGALVKLDRSQPIAQGDEVQVAVDWSLTPGLISSDELVTGEVVRVSAIDYLSQSVAVKFVRGQIKESQLEQAATEAASQPQAA
jgi:hypothetical protein